MQKYKVKIPYVCEYYKEVEIEATNETDAEQIAFDMQVEGKLDGLKKHIICEECKEDKFEVERI